MLCMNCKKAQATKSYECTEGGKTSVKYFCMHCYARLYGSGKKSAEKAAESCSYCGMTAEAFKKRKLVGCAKCYVTLAHVAQPMVQRMQGEDAHCGKQPSGGQSEAIARRCDELKLMIEKFTREKQFDKSRVYTERLMQLQSGEAEEEFAWQRLILSKES